MSRFRRLAGVVAAFALLATAACSGNGGQTAAGAQVAEADRNGGTLNIGLSADPTGIDAAVVNQVWRTVARALSDSLVFYNPDTKKLEPWLATSWTVSPDARTYSFKLRDDVTFHDGTKLTSAVVKANLESLNRPGIHSSAKTIVQGISKITMPTEHDITVQFGQPNAAFLVSLSRAYVGIVSEKTAKLPVAERQKWIDGSGPFYLQEYVPNQRIVLKKRDDYHWAPAYFKHDGPAYLDQVVYKIIPEDSVRNGAVIGDDELQFIYWVNAKYVPQLQGAGLTISKTLNPATGLELPINSSSKFLKDVRVRQALQVGVNREELVKIASGGIDEPATGPLSKDNPFYSDQSALLKYDPDKAKSLLDQAGWSKIGADGIRVNAAGQQLSLRAPRDDAAFQVLQDQWKKIGIELVLDPPLAAEANEKLLSGTYDVAYWYASSPEPDVLRANYGTTTGSNRSFIAKDDSKGQELDRLLQQQNHTIDKAKRQQLVDQASRILVEQAYDIPVSNDVDVWAHSPRLHDIKPVGLDQYLIDAWLAKK
ncbi:peptide/nickel transport system substrate-binding protein [Kribbella aluminosa]|uniref:Peptide/nickel transport system substrate-binding protein n=1 Tax=Kribbella aluminosa TaxID=416017 RepID=A0ABS4UJ64_9ACTN|nr:ABC transporter substrate-binding protein [Kribbella aluminosa]MBP2351683.1 peptide/nickel transport system substrate-binding protein [Kribbella aluminosa]